MNTDSAPDTMYLYVYYYKVRGSTSTAHTDRQVQPATRYSREWIGWILKDMQARLALRKIIGFHILLYMFTCHLDRKTGPRTNLDSIRVGLCKCVEFTIRSLLFIFSSFSNYMYFHCLCMYTVYDWAPTIKLRR